MYVPWYHLVPLVPIGTRVRTLVLPYVLARVPYYLVPWYGTNGTMVYQVHVYCNTNWYHRYQWYHGTIGTMVGARVPSCVRTRVRTRVQTGAHVVVLESQISTDTSIAMAYGPYHLVPVRLITTGIFYPGTYHGTYVPVYVRPYVRTMVRTYAQVYVRLRTIMSQLSDWKRH